MTRPIAFATCREYADLDPDDRLLIPPLSSRGLHVIAAVWNDPAVDWRGFSAVILRSTWDYPDAYAAFLRWAESVPNLVNPLEMVRWNTDKRYLLALAAAGIPTVPTAFPARGEPWATPADWPELVVKPATSAGSRDTARYVAGDPRASAHVARLHHAGRVAMVQPYLHEVDQAGETGLIYAAGRFSHAIRKGPLLRVNGQITDQLFAAEDITPRHPAPEERVLGERVMAVIRERFGIPVYARVDLLPGPQVIEVELVEPSLYLGHGPGAAERVAAAIADAVGAAG